MKTVFNRDMVAHVWANRAQPHGRTSSGNFYFDGATLFSYGPHFVVGYFMPDAYARDGLPLVLLNSGSHSVTTGRHQNAARGALSGVSRMYVPHIEECDVRGIAHYGAGRIVDKLAEEMRAEADRAARPRIRNATRAGHLETAAQLRADALHLATVDAGLPLSAEHRKRARAAVRALKLEPPREPTREAAEAYALALNRDAWRADMRAKAEAAARLVDVIAGERDAGNSGGAALESWDVRARHVAELCQRGKLRAPAAFVRARRYVEGVRAAIEADVRAEKVEAARKLWPQVEAALRAAIAGNDPWHIEMHLRAHAPARGAFEALHGETGDAERRALWREAEARAAQLEAEEAARRGAQRLAYARVSFAEGDFATAATAARQAAADLVDKAEAEELAERAGARIAEQHAAEAEAWRAGERQHFPYRNGNRYALRVRGDRIETSGGARIPASAAPAAWRLIRGHVARGTGETIRPGVRLGHFTLDEIKGNGDIVAGCHVIEFAELERAAVALGLEA